LLPSASDALLEELKKRHLLMQDKIEAEQKTAAASFNSKAVFLFNAVNNSSILIDKSVDTKYKDGEMELTKSKVQNVKFKKS
jgi:hypothetical protein